MPKRAHEETRRTHSPGERSRTGLVLAVLGIALASLVQCGRPGSLRFKEQDGGHVLYAEGMEVGRIPPFEHPHVRAADRLEEKDEGVFLWTRTFANTSPRDLEDVRLVMDFELGEKSHFNLIPAVSYDGNEWGRGKEPKGFLSDGGPWSFAWHRASVPGGVYVEGERWTGALFGNLEGRALSFACSLIPKEDKTTLRLIAPEEERPLTYASRDQMVEGHREVLPMGTGEAVEMSAWLVVSAAGRRWRSIVQLLDRAWELNEHPTRPSFDAKTLWRLGVRYARESLWAEEGSFRGFSIGLRREGDRWIQRPDWKYEIGWCGQNASLANSLLVDHLEHGDDESLEKGLAALDTWAGEARLPNGLLRCHFDYVLGEEGLREEVQDSCNLGTAARNYFEAFDLARRCGLERPEYLETALGICDFAVAQQEEGGRLGKAWANDGEPVDREGTIGAFLIPPLVMAHERTEESKYLRAALAAFEYYTSEFQTNGFTTAGALDTYCIDRESAMPLLRSALMLHDLAVDSDDPGLEAPSAYIAAAEDISTYLATWQWHYTSSYPEGSLLERMNYDSFGGTSVSTQHHHMDPYALYWVNDWLRLAELSGRDIWRRRALAIWANGSFGVSDGTLDTGEGARPAGSQGEGFLHTRWGFEEGRGFYNSWLVAWPTAFRLETLRHLEDWSVLDNE